MATTTKRRPPQLTQRHPPLWTASTRIEKHAKIVRGPADGGATGHVDAVAAPAHRSATTAGAAAARAPAIAVASGDAALLAAAQKVPMSTASADGNINSVSPDGTRLRLAPTASRCQHPPACAQDSHLTWRHRECFRDRGRRINGKRADCISAASTPCSRKQRASIFSIE